MFKMTTLFKKIALATLVLAVGLAAFPFNGASAASSKDQGTPPADQTRGNARLEQTWTRLQKTYQLQGNRLAKAHDAIAKAQTLIDKANGKGWDTSAVQVALTAFSAVIPAAQSAHDVGAAIISSHAGFDADGKVTDRTTAIATVKSLRDVLQNARTAMNGTGKALQDAIKALRKAHPRPAATTTP